MTTPTRASRAGPSGGTLNGAPVAARRRLVRVSRAAMVGSGTRKSRAMSAVGTPMTSRSDSAAADLRCQRRVGAQNTRRSRSSADEPTRVGHDARRIVPGLRVDDEQRLLARSHRLGAQPVEHPATGCGEQPRRRVGRAHPRPTSAGRPTRTPRRDASSARSRRRNCATSRASSRPQCSRNASSSAISGAGPGCPGSRPCSPRVTFSRSPRPARPGGSRAMYALGSRAHSSVMASRSSASTR